MKVGQTDVFEREYMGKFRAFAAAFGEFVAYERDRAARDLGLHIARKQPDGSEELSSTLAWFQMKGITAKKLPIDDYNNSDTVQIRLEVAHLKFWYRQPMPTYLVLYIQAAEQFLIADIQQIVESKWGNKILELDAKTVTVEVPKFSRLDTEAFEIILRKGEFREWARVFGISETDANICLRDSTIIYSLGTAAARGVECKVVIRDWISKTRTEVHFFERKCDSDGEWELVHQHWQLMLPADKVEEVFYYVSFFADEDDEAEWEYDADSSECRPLLLRNDDVVYPREFGGEYGEFSMRARLNEEGKKLLGHVKKLIDAHLLSLQKNGTFVSVAPWHARAV